LACASRLTGEVSAEPNEDTVPLPLAGSSAGFEICRMDPIEAIEELARRVEGLLTTAREAGQRVEAAQAEATQWKDKVKTLEARIVELEAQAKAREERMQAAADRVKTLLDKLPEAI